MEIKHVILDSMTHFLVVDGTRGPVCNRNSEPAWHPSGLAAFLPNAWEVGKHLKGRLFHVVEEPHEVEEITMCEPAKKAWDEFAVFQNECNQIVMRRYDAAPGPEPEPKPEESVL